MLQQDVIMEDPVWSFPSSLTFPTCGFHLTELIGLVRDILLSDREFPQWFWVFWSDSWDSHRFSWWFILAYYAITCFLCASEIRYLLVIADSYLRTGILSSAIVMICFGLFGLLLVLLCCTYGVWLLVHSVCSPYVLISFLSSSPFALLTKPRLQL